MIAVRLFHPADKPLDVAAFFCAAGTLVNATRKPPLTLAAGFIGATKAPLTRGLSARQPTTMALLLARRMACVELVETIHGSGRGDAGREGGEQGEDGDDLLHTILLSGWVG